MVKVIWQKATSPLRTRGLCNFIHLCTRPRFHPRRNLQVSNLDRCSRFLERHTSLMPSLHRPPDPTKQCCVCRDSGIWIVNSRNWTAQTRRPAPISSLLFLTRRRCIAGSAPSTPCTMDSSALETRSRRARRNQYDAAGAFSCARRRSDVTRCNDIEMITYGLLCVIRNHPIQPEVHNVSQRRQKRAKPRRPLVMIRRVVPEIYWRTGRRTDRHAHHNTPFLLPVSVFLHLILPRVSQLRRR